MKSRLAAACGVAIVMAIAPVWSLAEDKPAAKPAEKPPEKAAEKPAEKAPEKAPAKAAEAPKTDKPAATQPAGPLKERAGYVLGLIVAQQLQRMGLPPEVVGEFDEQSFVKGMSDTLQGAKPKLSRDDMQMTMMEFQKVIVEKSEKAMKEAGEKNKVAGEAYLAKNKTAEGVKTTASGLQYKVLKEGTGKAPAAADSVTVHYKGTLVDGTVFDSSYDRGEPASFPVSGGIIKGWTEALLLMKIGSKYQLAIPADLGYGEFGRPPQIGPNAVLVFEIELISIEPADIPAAAPAPAPAPKGK